MNARTISKTRTTARRTAVAAALTATAVGAGLFVGQGSVSATTTPASAVDTSAALLRAGQMPVVNEVQDWTRTERRRGRISNAQTESLRELGATDIARRDFALPGATGSSAVLAFDSVVDAKAAYREIKSWREDTGANVPDEGRLLFTEPLRSISVDEGTGAYFGFVFVEEEDAVEGTFEWLGVTRRGADVSVVAWRVGGTDATYEVDPTLRSVRLANKKLAKLG
jgi:hypothetical protein